MSSLLISLIVFVCVLGGALLGLFLHFRLPDQHLASDSKDVVRLAMGLVATTVAIALGLLVGSAKSFFDTQNAEVAQLAANALLLDRILANYGPDAKDARKKLRTLVAGFDRLTLSSAVPDLKGEEVFEAVQALDSKTDLQRTLRDQAVGLEIQLGQTRWLMFEQRTVPVPTVLLAVLVFWLVALFTSFGIFVKPNATVVICLIVSAFAISAAIFLIVEMYHPYSGLIQVSNEPIRAAMRQLGN